METVVTTHIENLSKSVQYFRQTYVLSEEDRVNKFLDAINSVKSRISDKTSSLEELIENYEEFSHINNGILENDVKELLLDLLGRSRVLHSFLVRDYVTYNNVLRPNNILKSDLNEYKSSIDDFKETLEDITDIFFSLNYDSDFQSISQQIDDEIID